MKTTSFCKRMLLVGLTSLMVAAPQPAQAGWKMRIRRAPKTLYQKVVSSYLVERQLERRVAQSYKKAKQAQQSLPHTRAIALGEPVHRVLHPEEASPIRVYPDNPFLDSPHKQAYYMVAQSNRLFLREVERMQGLWQQLDAHFDQLQQAAQESVQPANPVAWAVRQLPAKTSVVFVGEVHGYIEIRQNVELLLQRLRHQNPERQIILLTEFLPEDFRVTEQTTVKDVHLQQYFPVWQTALENDIQVIGLEPQYAMEDQCRVTFLRRDNTTGLRSQWAHLEGMRVRNEVFARTIEKQRAQNPDALLVVYTGAGHSYYNMPFTLSKALPQETPFVLALHPQMVYHLEWGKGLFSIATETRVPYEEMLEQLTQPGSFPQQMIYFRDPTLSNLAGFDIRIKIDTNAIPLD